MWFGKTPQIDCADLKRALRRLGFEPEPGKGSSHEQWRLVIDGRLYKVTVDCPKAPFSDDLLSSMANQAGLSKRELIAYCKDKKRKGHPKQKT